AMDRNNTTPLVTVTNEVRSRSWDVATHRPDVLQEHWLVSGKVFVVWQLSVAGCCIALEELPQIRQTLIVTEAHTLYSREFQIRNGLVSGKSKAHEDKTTRCVCRGFLTKRHMYFLGETQCGLTIRATISSSTS